MQLRVKITDRLKESGDFGVCAFRSDSPCSRYICADYLPAGIDKVGVCPEPIGALGLQCSIIIK